MLAVPRTGRHVEVRVSGGDRFDRAAATWDELPRRVQLARAVANAIVRQVRLPQDLDVLDFGCGTGLLTLALQPLVRSITGADTSAGMLEVLERKVDEQGLGNVKTVLLRRGELATPTPRYHLIVSSMTLHHVADIAPLLGGFYRQLHAGGSVALADLDREDGSYHEEGSDVFHLGFDRSELQELLAGAGFIDLGAATAFVVHKGGRDYPIFLITGRKPS